MIMTELTLRIPTPEELLEARRRDREPKIKAGVARIADELRKCFTGQSVTIAMTTDEYSVGGAIERAFEEGGHWIATVDSDQRDGSRIMIRPVRA